MKKNLTILIVCLFYLVGYKAFSQTSGNAGANYCTPSIASGCTNWRTISVNVGPFSWSQETSTDCETSNFLGDTIRLNPGMTYSMEVSNANWCGAGVWIDFDNDFGLDTSDNVFHKYEANETNIYQFSLNIPETMLPGNYRLRVLTGWGTDCYNQSNNGFGPCGQYEYGNFQDFTLKISNPTSVIKSEKSNPLFVVSQSPDFLKLTLQAPLPKNAAIRLFTLQGKVVGEFWPESGQCEIATTALPEGVYLVGVSGQSRIQKVLIQR